MESCRKEVRNVFVSSESRDINVYPNGNNYVLHLTTPIKDVEKVELLSASIPNSIYNITDGSNIIAFSNTTTGFEVPELLTYVSIPPGFYSASGLATEIQNAEFAECGITITHLNNEGKFLFTRPTSEEVFSIYVPEKSREILGFYDNQAIDSSNTSSLVSSSNNLPLYYQNTRYDGKNFIKSQKVYNLNVNEGIFLDIEELRTIFNEAAMPTNTNSNFFSSQNIARSFGQIPMDVSRGEVKKFKKSTDFDLAICYPQIINKIDRLTVRWTDIHNRLLNFNGLNDNSFILRFHTLRRNLC